MPATFPPFGSLHTDFLLSILLLYITSYFTSIQKSAKIVVGLIIHIHAKNTENTGLCKGPVLFVIQNPANAKEVFKTDSNGKFSLKNQEFNLAPPSVPVPGKPPAPPADLSKFDTWYVNVHDLNLVQIGGREQNQWRSLPESRGRVEINVAAYRSAVRPGSESYPLLYFFNSFAV